MEQYQRATDEPVGVWIDTIPGAGVARGDPVRPGELQNALAGYDAAGIRKIAHNAGSDHKGGWDLTFSAPKSVSVVWACAGFELHQAVERAQQKSVMQALEFAKRSGAFFARTTGELLANVHAGYFQHSASRAGDPHLHSHVVVSNLSKDGRSIDFRARYAKSAGAYYRAALAHELVCIGLNVEADGSKFKIADVPDGLVSDLSSRSKEIGEQRSRRASEIERMKTAARKGAAPRAEAFARAASAAAKYDFVPERLIAQYLIPPFTPEQALDAIIEHAGGSNVLLLSDAQAAVFDAASQFGCHPDQAWEAALSLCRAGVSRIIWRDDISGIFVISSHKHGYRRLFGSGLSERVIFLASAVERLVNSGMSEEDARGLVSGAAAAGSLLGECVSTEYDVVFSLDTASIYSESSDEDAGRVAEQIEQELFNAARDCDLSLAALSSRATSEYLMRDELESGNGRFVYDSKGREYAVFSSGPLAGRVFSMDMLSRLRRSRLNHAVFSTLYVGDQNISARKFISCTDETVSMLASASSRLERGVAGLANNLGLDLSSFALTSRRAGVAVADLAARMNALGAEAA